MTSIDLTPREKICCFTSFLTPKLNFSACSKNTSRKAVFWTISPGLSYSRVKMPRLVYMFAKTSENENKVESKEILKISGLISNYFYNVSKKLRIKWTRC